MKMMTEQKNTVADDDSGGDDSVFEMYDHL
jgi:hypothetical protein